MTLFKNSLMRGESTVAHAGRRSAHGLEYQLPGGRTVQVEELCFRISRLGVLAGAGGTHSREGRERASQAGACAVSGPGNYGLIIKPVPEGTLPAYVLMAALASDQPVSDPSADCSRIPLLAWQ